MASSVQEVQQLSLCAVGSNSSSTLSSLQHNRGRRRRRCSCSSNSSSIWGGGLTTRTRRLLVVCVPPWQRTSQLLQSIALLPRAQRLDTKRAPRDQGHCKLSLCCYLIYFLSFHNTDVCVCLCLVDLRLVRHALHAPTCLWSNCSFLNPKP
jgi:hypothetical protein